MAHAGEAFDHDHHALAGPQVAVEPVRERALQQGVGASYSVTSCDLRILMDQPTESISS